MKAWLPPGPLRQSLAASAFVVSFAALAIVATTVGRGLYDEKLETQALSERLAALQARAARAPVAAANPDAEAGSPLIEGATRTQAGAALQQRIERAVGRAGGNLLSSEVSLQADSAPEFLSLAADVDLAEPALQTLLYDLEAGMPYLFVDKLSAHAAETSGDGPRRLRVALTVSGKWSAPR